MGGYQVESLHTSQVLPLGEAGLSSLKQSGLAIEITAVTAHIEECPFSLKIIERDGFVFLCPGRELVQGSCGVNELTMVFGAGGGQPVMEKVDQRGQYQGRQKHQEKENGGGAG